MKLVVYADESGTNDPSGERPDSRVAIVAGYIGRRNEWLPFCQDWNRILGSPQYAVPYFHYRELANNKKKSSIYYGWDTDKVQNFLFDLAEVAGRFVPVGGCYNLEAHAKMNKHDKTYPYSFVFKSFFTDVAVAINEHYRGFEGIDFFFDQKKGDSKWAGSLYEVFSIVKKMEKRFGSLTFADKKQHPHWPLQAADMYAYRFRKRAPEHWITERDKTGKFVSFTTKKVQLMEVLDYVLMRRSHPGGFFPMLAPELLQDAIRMCNKYPSAMRAIMENSGPNTF